VNHFRSPQETLGDLSAERAAVLLAASSDVALILDGQGIIRDVASGSDDMPDELFDGLIGRPWRETVTVDSRDKVASLLDEAGRAESPRWRHINHAWEQGRDLPVLYTTVAIDPDGGRVAAVGRDLRPIANLQKRLIEAQQSIERDYARLRQAEMRYRLLFEIASEGVLVLESASGKIVEVNPAAAEMLGSDMQKLMGQSFPFGFDEAGTQTIQELFARARASVDVESVTARRAETGEAFTVSASMFRQDNRPYILLRLSRPDAGAAAAPTPVKSQALDVLQTAPDGFVVTDTKGTVLMTNQAFLDLIEMATEDQVMGQSLDRWIGRFGSEFNVLLSSLREQGSLRFFNTRVRGEHGGGEDVELSAVAVLDGEQPCMGFMLRATGGRMAKQAQQPAKEMPRSVEQLTELVGRIPLREIVRESTDVIERLCIEAALELTSNNRASAAEMLGLSRQSLYVKLRRYGLLDAASSDSG